MEDTVIREQPVRERVIVSEKRDTPSRWILPFFLVPLFFVFGWAANDLLRPAIDTTQYGVGGAPSEYYTSPNILTVTATPTEEPTPTPTVEGTPTTTITPVETTTTPSIMDEVLE